MSGPADLDRYEQRTSESPEVEDIHASIYREKMEPRDGYQPVPMTLLLIFFGFLMWGGWYLGEYDAAFEADRLEGPQAFARVAAEAPEAEPEIDPMAVGQRVYAQCSACHQANGQGVANQFPPLAGSEWVTGSEARLVRILLHGMQGPVEVKGEVYNAVMPAWPQLSDAEIAYVLTYVRKSWGNEAAAVAPEAVSRIRDATADRSAAYSAEELLALEEAP